jgi:phosphoribosylanthranilate isomerase
VTKVFVKICGITRPQDADLAIELGADALGFVFWPGSPRYISPDAARAILQRASWKAGSVLAVGVFVDEPVEDVARVMDTVGLTAAQLHGNESAEYCRQLAQLGSPPAVAHQPGPSSSGSPTTPRDGARDGRRRLIKAIGMRAGEVPDINEFAPDVLILLDAHDPSRYGGTGRTIDWSSARQIATSRRTILAGGLNPANIGLALAAVQPYGVDVSSGVESAPGVKDPDRLKSLFEALND